MEQQVFYEKLAALFPDRLQFETLLAPYTTWRIGGPARALFQPQDTGECMTVLSLAAEYSIAVTYLGGGSNVLISDEGLPGLVLLTHGLQKIHWQGNRVRVGAGYRLPKLSWEAGQKGFSGLEFAVGIPGTLGGAVLMNAGAYDGCLSEVIESVEVVTPDGEKRLLGKDELTFGYRISSIKGSGLLITEVTLLLQPGDVDAITRRMREFYESRKQKQPLRYPNAGSVFKNPLNDSAGRLIEAAGAKGLTVGGAQVSTKHANFIVNLGGATAQDVLTIIKEVQALVFEKFSLLLDTEIVLLGFDNNGR